MNKFSLTVNYISSTSQLTCKNLFDKILEKEYSDCTGWGYSNVSLDESLIMGTLLKSVIRYYQEWNPETSVLEKKSYTQVKEINFRIDLLHSSFIVEGGVKDMNIVKQSLRQIAYNEFTYIPLDITLYGLLAKFSFDAILESIEEVVLTDYRADKIFVGNYSAKLINPFVKIESLANYEKLIGRFKAVLSLSERRVVVTANSKSNFIIIGSENDKLEFMDYLTNKLLSNG